MQKTIIHQIMILLFLIKVIYSRLRKLYLKNFTPLHWAALCDSKDIGELLISKGADINTKNIISQIKIILFFIKII